MTTPLPATIANELAAALRGLRYGSIQLIVHDAKVVRIERVERIRLTDSSEAPVVTSGQPTTIEEVRRHEQEEA